MRLRWHLRRIRWAEPGTRGLAILGIVAILTLFPFQLLSSVESRSYVVSVSQYFGTFALSFLVLELSAQSDAVEYWLALQGKRPSEWALERWAANLAFACAVVLVWVTLSAAAALAYGDASFGDSVGSLTTLWLVLLLASAVFFLLGATGTKQAQALAFLVVILTVFAPMFVRVLPAGLSRAIETVLPPLMRCAEVTAALKLREWSAAVSGLLRIGTWCVAAMGLGVLLLDRRVPRP